jgi:hypothetical protein
MASTDLTKSWHDDMWWVAGVAVLTVWSGYQIWRGLTKGRLMGRFGSEYDRARDPLRFWAMFSAYAMLLGLVCFVGLFALMKHSTERLL